MLTREAWNALLKILEEPPPGVVFVFATTEPQKIANTASNVWQGEIGVAPRSRCEAVPR